MVFVAYSSTSNFLLSIPYPRLALPWLPMTIHNQINHSIIWFHPISQQHATQSLLHFLILFSSSLSWFLSYFTCHNLISFVDFSPFPTPCPIHWQFLSLLPRYFKSTSLFQLLRLPSYSIPSFSVLYSTEIVF